jgi:hypothetical protein
MIPSDRVIAVRGWSDKCFLRSGLSLDTDSGRSICVCWAVNFSTLDDIFDPPSYEEPQWDIDWIAPIGKDISQFLHLKWVDRKGAAEK